MSREGPLAEALVALADTLVADYNVFELGHQLVAFCVELLDVDGAGITLADPAGWLQTLAASSERTRRVEEIQLRVGRGPGVDCFTSGIAVAEPDLRRSSRWPEFAATAMGEGFHTVHALPLRLRSQTLGALTLLALRPVPLSEADRRAGQALADVATIGILHERAVRRGAVLTGQLRRALTSRILVEQAKGVISAWAEMDMDAAFALLRRFARRHNQRLVEAARAVIDGSIDVAQMLDGPRDHRTSGRPEP